MRYYPHNISDFNNATRHLTRIERSVYRDLLDLYYDTEQPITLDMIYLLRKIIARSEEEATAVQQVLNEFFNKTEQGWFNERCDREISEYQALNSAKSIAGKASAAKRETERAEKLGKLNEKPTDLQQNPTGVEQVLDSVGSSVQLNRIRKLEIEIELEIEKEQKQRAQEIPNSEIQSENVKAAVAMKDAGMLHVMPSAPGLLAAITEGVTAELLAEVAQRHHGKNQAYIVQAALGQLRDSRANADKPRPRQSSGPAPPPQRRPTIEEHKAAARPFPSWLLSENNEAENASN